MKLLILLSQVAITLQIALLAHAQSPNPMKVERQHKGDLKAPGSGTFKDIQLPDNTLIKNMNAPQISIFDHQHSTLSKLLKEFVVVNGPVSQVKYKELKLKRNELDNYLVELSHVKQTEFDSWSKEQQIAFLINAYNGFTLKLIIDNFPVKSIKDIGGLFSSPWKQDFFSLLGDKRTLDWIEHSVLRKKYKEPRIHFAVNCASVGCPALRAEAFRAVDLERQLNEQTQLFLSDTKRNSLSSESLTLSKIFDWFEDDFKEAAGSVENFIAGYMTKDKVLQNKIKSGKMPIKYSPYDWNLNIYK